MKPRSLWLGLHAEVPDPDDPERMLLLNVRVVNLTTEGRGRVLLDGVELEDVRFEDGLIQELARALEQIQSGAAAIGQKVWE